MPPTAIDVAPMPISLLMPSRATMRLFSIGPDAAAEHHQREAEPVLKRREPEEVLEHERRVRDQRHDADEAERGARHVPDGLPVAQDCAVCRDALQQMARGIALRAADGDERDGETECAGRGVHGEDRLPCPERCDLAPDERRQDRRQEREDRHPRQHARRLLAAPPIEDDGAREHAARRRAEPLQEPPEHERHEALRQRRHDGSQDINREPRGEHALAPVLIRQRPVDQRAQRQAEQQRAQRELHGPATGRKAVGDERQRRHVQVVRQRPEGGQNPQERNEPAELRLLGCGRRHYFDGHRRDGAAHREDRDRGVEQELARRALGRAGDGEERADLEAALPRVAQRLLVGVRDELRAIVREKAREELAIPRFVDRSRVGRRRPMRDAARADSAMRSGCASHARRNARPNS